MSSLNKNEDAGATNSTEKESSDAAQDETKISVEYLAPIRYYQGSGPPLRPDFYAVTLQKPHTVENHWEVIGERIGMRWTSEWYDATLSEAQIECIRRDPVVKSIVQYGRAVWG